MILGTDYADYTADVNQDCEIRVIRAQEENIKFVIINFVMK